MITTETLKEILRDLRHEQNHNKETIQPYLEGYYNSKYELLEKLISISEEEEKNV